ncbi:MAG: hypothetical protein H5T99_09640 [Moorella sp. (in: Bacteria)]|nr:hypothetical protein [Moorella sp. (in: firmicutes)]
MRYKYIPGSLAALLLGAFILFLLITCGLPGRGSGPVKTGEGPFPQLRPGSLLEPPAGAKEPPATRHQDQAGPPGQQGTQPEYGAETPAPAGPGQEENSHLRTESEVWQEFEPRLAALQVKYQGELDALVARAFSDYQRYIYTTMGNWSTFYPLNIQRNYYFARRSIGGLLKKIMEIRKEL